MNSNLELVVFEEREQKFGVHRSDQGQETRTSPGNIGGKRVLSDHCAISALSLDRNTLNLLFKIKIIIVPSNLLHN